MGKTSSKGRYPTEEFMLPATELLEQIGQGFQLSLISTGIKGG